MLRRLCISCAALLMVQASTAFAASTNATMFQVLSNGFHYSVELAPDGGATAFTCETSEGTLSIALASIDADPQRPPRVTYSLAGAPVMFTTVATRGDVPGGWWGTTTFGDLGELHYAYDDETGDLSLRGTTLDDAAALLDVPLYRAINEAAEKIHGELSMRRPTARYEVELDAVTVLAAFLPTLDPGFGIPPFSSAPQAICDGSTETFQACNACCEEAVALLPFGCQLAASFFCSDSSQYCRWIRRFTCDAIADLSLASCVNGNCRGKPGDPECMDPPPCEPTYTCYNSGTCGILSCTKCGACGAGETCCGPCP